MTPTDDPLPALTAALLDPDPAARAKAARDLGRLGWLARDALPALAAAATDADPRVREAAAQAVGVMGPEAVPTLAALLLHKDKYVRRHAVWGLGRSGPAARVVVPDLCRALKDRDPRTASGAAQALGGMGAAGADAVPALAEAMRGTNIVLCRLAARALSQIGPPALETLTDHLGHSDPFVRGESALAVGWMGPAAAAAVPALARVVRGAGRAASPSGERKLAAVGSGVMTPTGPPDAGEVPPEELCRVYAAQALGRIGPTAANAAGALRAATRADTAGLRQAARQALKRIEGGPPSGSSEARP